MRRMYDENEIKSIANTIIDDTQAAIDSTYSSSKITMALDEKENKLISGLNIKTINGTSILGSGNVEAGGGKLYAHSLTIRLKDPNRNSVAMYSRIYSSINTPANNSATLVSLLNRGHVPAWGNVLNGNHFSPYSIQSIYADGSHFSYTYFSPNSDTQFSIGEYSNADCTEITIGDLVAEL